VTTPAADSDTAETMLAEILADLDAPQQATWQALEARALAAKQAANDADAKNRLWAVQAFAKAMATYVGAFEMMKAADHFGAWKDLEQVEIALKNSAKNPFLPELVPLIGARAGMIARWQSLFPYRFFMSPGMIKKNWECSICGKKSTPISPCGHTPGQVYAGELAVRRITEVDLLEISIVTEPVQKYSVAFVKGQEFDYGIVDFVLEQLGRPFDPWEGVWGFKRHAHEHFPDLGLDDPCPCGSDLRYGECCRQKSGIRLRHFHLFSDDSLVVENSRRVGTFRRRSQGRQ